MATRIIPTTYRGRRFRSRTEARYAVAFDHICLAWDYEREGFDLSDGIKYLPDFWLPQVEMWAEVKGKQATSAERKKAELLAKVTGFPCIILDGMPFKRSYDYVRWMPDVDAFEWDDCVISMYKNYPRREGRFYSNTGGLDLPCFGEFGSFYDWGEAVDVALGARFEFGESGPFRLNDPVCPQDVSTECASKTLPTKETVH